MVLFGQRLVVAIEAFPRIGILASGISTNDARTRLDLGSSGILWNDISQYDSVYETERCSFLSFTFLSTREYKSTLISSGTSF